MLLLWGRKPLQRKRPFTSCCENGSSYGFQTKNLKFTDSRLDSSGLISTSKFVEQLVCSILLYLMMYLFCVFCDFKAPEIALVSCVILYWLFIELSCFWIKEYFKWSGILVSASGRSAPVVGSCLTSQVWIGRGRFASCHRPISRHFSWEGYLFLDFFRGRLGFGFFGGLLVLCFPASLLFCCSAALLFCFFASLLFCFLLFLLLCFSACLLLFFSASLLSLLLCFCASLPFYFYYSTFSFLQSCVFAVLLPAPLLLCFLSLLPPCFFSFPVLYSLLFVS